MSVVGRCLPTLRGLAELRMALPAMRLSSGMHSVLSTSLSVAAAGVCLWLVLRKAVYAGKLKRESRLAEHRRHKVESEGLNVQRRSSIEGEKIRNQQKCKLDEDCEKDELLTRSSWIRAPGEEEGFQEKCNPKDGFQEKSDGELQKRLMEKARPCSEVFRTPEAEEQIRWDGHAVQEANEAGSSCGVGENGLKISLFEKSFLVYDRTKNEELETIFLLTRDTEIVWKERNEDGLKEEVELKMPPNALCNGILQKDGLRLQKRLAIELRVEVEENQGSYNEMNNIKMRCKDKRQENMLEELKSMNDYLKKDGFRLQETLRECLVGDFEFEITSHEGSSQANTIKIGEEDQIQNCMFKENNDLIYVTDRILRGGLEVQMEKDFKEENEVERRLTVALAEESCYEQDSLGGHKMWREGVEEIVGVLEGVKDKNEFDYEFEEKNGLWDSKLSQDTGLPDSPREMDREKASGWVERVCDGDKAELECCERNVNERSKRKTPISIIPSTNKCRHGCCFLSSDSEECIIWELRIPKSMVGRLIGKAGGFIKYLMEESGASMFVCEVPQVAAFQVCHMEGSPSQVQKALVLIREKFKSLNLANIASQAHLPSISAPTLPTLSWMRLPAGEAVSVWVVCISSVVRISVHHSGHPACAQLPALHQSMAICYHSMNAPCLSSNAEVGSLCAVSVGDSWLRAQLMAPLTSPALTQIRLLDYGRVLSLPSTSLRRLRTEFASLPFQAIDVCLSNVAPLPGEDSFSPAAVAVLERLTTDAPLLAQVVCYDPCGLPCIYLWRTRDETCLINKELGDRGYAQWLDM
uniref:Tudor domain-containing protein n=1 Tax=Eptatretus burgeri TaxID=7764 RepID=A0A8C4WZ69_EPTBU